MKEQWLPIVDYEGYYEISNYGRVKSLKRKGKLNEQILKPNKNKKGYLFVILSNKCIGKIKYVHKLVAMHYLDNIENKPQVNHIDCNKTNNYIKNLEWVTSKENVNHAKKAGLLKKSGINKGEKNKMSKLKESDVKFILYLKKRFKLSNVYLGKLFNVSRMCISSIVNKRRWSYIHEK